MLPSQAGPAAHGHSAAGRVLQLDSIRGVAALTVVFHHLWAISQFHEPPWYLIPFTSGREAVVLFFVLSGYVLSLPFWKDRQLPYPVYIVRRFFRIYVPFLAALALSLAGCALLYKTHLPLTSFYLKTWQVPVTFKLFLHALLMPDTAELNGAIWSLRYEMEMSIIFPAVCILLARAGRYSWIWIAILLQAFQMLILHTSLGRNSVTASNVAQLMYYAIFFVIGAGLAQHRADLIRQVFLLPQIAIWSGFAFSLALYFNRMFLHMTTPKSDFLTMAGASGIILLAQDARLKVGLDTVTAQYLGRISYSMYLIHYVVLFALFNLLYLHVPLGWLIAACVVTTLAVSHLFCVGVEERALISGKWVSNRLTWLESNRSAISRI